MAGIFTKVYNMFVGDAEEDYYDDDFDYELDEKINKSKNEQNTSNNLRVVSSNTTTAKSQVILYKAEKFDDCTEIGNSINEQKTVVLNLEDSKREVARRIIDFISGVAYANNGQLHRIANMTFIVTPNAVDVDKEAFDMLTDTDEFYTNQTNN